MWGCCSQVEQILGAHVTGGCIFICQEIGLASSPVIVVRAVQWLVCLTMLAPMLAK